MGKAWFDRYPVAKQTFAAADQALGFSLSDACFRGPEQQLNRTDVAQAAIYTVSVACYQALIESEAVEGIDAAAGLSLGEFTALHLAGAFDFVEGLQLVRLRGQAMQDAAEANPGSMVAITGEVSEAIARALCEKALAQTSGGGQVLVPANYNSPMQVVVSGTADACATAVDVAAEMGLRATPLTVAGAFHSPLMQPAADRLAEALARVNWQAPTCPVYANVTAAPHDADPASISQRLVEQLTSPVKWTQSIQAAAADHPPVETRYVELAPGRVLSGLARRIDRSLKAENFAEPI